MTTTPQSEQSKRIDKILKPWRLEIESEYGTGINDEKKPQFVAISDAKAQLLALMEWVVGDMPKLYINGGYPDVGDEVSIDLENNRRESLVFIQDNGKRTLWEQQCARIKQLRGE